MDILSSICIGISCGAFCSYLATRYNKGYINLLQEQMDSLTNKHYKFQNDMRLCDDSRLKDNDSRIAILKLKQEKDLEGTIGRFNVVETRLNPLESKVEALQVDLQRLAVEMDKKHRKDK